jgi:hypothetical protein
MIGTISGFVIKPSQVLLEPVKLQASPNRWSEFTTIAAALTTLTTPLVAFAEAVDDYEYGAVNAPIGELQFISFVLCLSSGLLTFHDD